MDACWITHTVCQKQLLFAETHALLMSQGASTYSFKSQSRQNENVYQIGKIGELAVYKFLLRSGFRVTHTPFRESYEKFNWNDDFQIELPNGTTKQIEVRCKARNVDPQPDYECCSDCIKPNLDYIFVSFNRNTNNAFIVGWADFKTWQAFGKETIKGTKNNNFSHRVTEFNINIENLNPMTSYRKSL